MKRLPIVLLLLAVSVLGMAQEFEEPAAFQFIIGPRIGVNYLMTTTADFTTRINEMYIFPEGTYYPVMSLFGLIAEQRILLGETRSHFAFQEILLVNGLEQSIAIPSFSLLIGYRDASGFELGFGPNISVNGIGVLVAVGYTFSAKGVFVPVDVSVVLPNAQRPTSLALTTGFNFVTRSRQN